MYDFRPIRQALEGLGVGQGDLLYVASDATRLLVSAVRVGYRTPAERDAFLHSFIDELKDVVGETGTLLFPVFTWDFCRGKGFDRRSSLGEVGSLNNWILANRPDFTRTQHPLYSFMVWGAQAETLAAMDNVDSWGEDSPFAYLHHNNGKLLLFSVSLQRGFTFMHYVGRSVRVPYRYMKAFRGEYIDTDGTADERVYTMYVRDLAIESEEYEPDEWLLDAGVMAERVVDDMPLRVVDLPRAYDVVADDLLNHGAAKCYKFKNYQVDWQRGQTHPDDYENGLPKNRGDI